jgi:hypothetical protein
MSNVTDEDRELARRIDEECITWVQKSAEMPSGTAEWVQVHVDIEKCASLLASRRESGERCRWTWDDKYECYEASCGEAWCPDGTPEENHYTFCPACGKRVETVMPEPEEEEDE